MMKIVLFVFVLLVSTVISSQDSYENGSIDFGLGAVISVGLQEEVGFNIRSQFTSSTKKSTYIVEYNRFFIKEFENTEVYNDFGVAYNVRLIHWESLSVTGGIGYVGNDYEVLSKAEDTSNLFFFYRKF
ncbi:hypothetical protein SAMN04487910_3301 [Aquimarina amphilecti]|uniref:Outer membrane protein beta-barrel domain-containing protein n=1 Tax=Aquimarina amphilecti TaxID=1038014 RepID=A0A1H7T6Z9_AQUAM|nr:hypothetical protein [Aquimarina amphilecti]SEL80289.1 hypothetical protein SAMN04487910_3301 [Aquimarina amphilecti]